MTTIINIHLLPNNPTLESDFIPVIITSGIPSYFRITGTELDKIISVKWYPKNPDSVQFVMRELILVDSTVGTFMIKVTDNYLDITDRKGYLSFKMEDGSNMTFTVKTFGPVSMGPLWTSPDSGLITG
jgi:hypothetical protein